MTQESRTVKLKIISSKVLPDVHIKMIFLLILEALKYAITGLLPIFPSSPHYLLDSFWLFRLPLLLSLTQSLFLGTVSQLLITFSFYVWYSYSPHHHSI